MAIMRNTELAEFGNGMSNRKVAIFRGFVAEQDRQNSRYIILGMRTRIDGIA